MKLIRELLIVFALCLVGEVLSALLPIPFPSSVIAMMLLLALLLSKLIRRKHIENTSGFILKNMSFFFIPAGVSLLKEFDRVRDSILPFLVICAVSTLLTFAASAYTVQGVISLQQKRLHKRKENAN